jgi:hypothetical protein
MSGKVRDQDFYICVYAASSTSEGIYNLSSVSYFSKVSNNCKVRNTIFKSVIHNRTKFHSYKKHLKQSYSRCVQSLQ